MRTYYFKTIKNKFLFIIVIIFSLSSCTKPDDGVAPSVIIQAQEISSTEKVISGDYEVRGATEELV